MVKPEAKAGRKNKVVPMAIHALGGLPEGEINERILQSRLAVGEMLDKKLGELKADISERMDERMDAHEKIVSERLDGQDEKLQQANNKIEEVLGVVKGIAAQGVSWNEEHVGWRDKVDHQLKDADAKMGKVEEFMRSLKMMAATLRALTILRKSTLYFVKEGKQYMLALTTIFSGWIVIWQFVHTVWPEYVHPWLLHHFSR